MAPTVGIAPKDRWGGLVASIRSRPTLAGSWKKPTNCMRPRLNNRLDMGGYWGNNVVKKIEDSREVFMLILSIFLNLMGTLLLAFGVQHYLKWVGLVVEAHQMFLEQSTSAQSTPTLVTGVEKHLQNAISRDRYIIVIGLLFNVVGLVLQIVAQK